MELEAELDSGICNLAMYSDQARATGTSHCRKRRRFERVRLCNFARNFITHSIIRSSATWWEVTSSRVPEWA